MQENSTAERPEVMFRQVGVGRKVIVGILLCLAFLCFGITWCLDVLYYQTRPNQPQPLEDRIYGTHVYRGGFVYLTHGEQLALHYSSPLGFLIGVVGAFLLYRGRWHEQ